MDLRNNFLVAMILKLSLFCLFLLLVEMSAAVAEQTPVTALDPLKAAEQQNAKRQTLEQESAELQQTRRELDALSKEMPTLLDKLQVGQITEAMVQQARLDLETIRLHQADLQAEIADTERRIKDLTQSLKDLEAREQLLKNPAKDAIDSAERAQQLERIARAQSQQRVDLELESQHLANLRSLAELATLRQALKEQWRARVEELYGQKQELNRREAQVDLVQRLQREKQGYLVQIAELRRRLEKGADSLSEAQHGHIDTLLQNALEQINLIDLDIRLASLGNEMARLNTLANQTDAKSDDLQEGLDQNRTIQNDLKTAESLLQRKVDLYEQQKQVVERDEGQNRVIGKLVDDLNGRLSQVRELLEKNQELRTRLEENYKVSLNKDLFARQKLPASREEWRQFLDLATTVPKVLLYQVKLSLESVGQSMMKASALRWLGLLAALLGLIWLIRVARHGLKRLIASAQAQGEGGFTRNFIGLTLAPLLRRNLLGVGSALALLQMVWIFQVPQPGLGIIMTLVLLWVGIKTPINLAWLLLASPHLPEEQRRPGLYRQWFLILLSGGILAAMCILARLCALPEAIIDALDRLFMAQWLIASLPVLRSQMILFHLLEERFSGRYWFIGLRILTVGFRFALSGAALLGLVGYRNLAWAVAWHLLILVWVGLGLLVLRGLLHDFIVWLKNFAVVHSDYGLLWTQDVINPIHRILDVLLYLSAWVVLFGLYGLGLESPLVVVAWQILERPLFSLAGAEISLWRIIVTVMTVMVVIWSANWCRGMTYRWVFSRIADLGVRHSLSVFTQYFIVLTGLLITLRLLGLDLTTLTVFAGAVGVGIGFGLKNIADNFISGLMLLIERPLRSGDIVKIGENEGEITRIGIRSLSMKTWDNMEVIIPNSEVITNAFVNWTHRDKVLRTVLIVGVSYDNDPHSVKAVLEQVLKDNDAVLDDPAPLVLLWEFADSAVNFRIQYFIDVGRDSLVKTRAEVLFAIWDGFKHEGIDIPYPQRDLYIKEWPEALAWRRSDETSGGRMKAVGQAP